MCQDLKYICRTKTRREIQGVRTHESVELVQRQSRLCQVENSNFIHGLLLIIGRIKYAQQNYDRQTCYNIVVNILGFPSFIYIRLIQSI